MTTLFWDRQNRPIEDVIDWARKFEDVGYRVIAVDSDGPGLPMVSTIWQGMDLAHMLHVTDDTAYIFETAFVLDGQAVETFIWHSEEDALAGHRKVCVEMLGREPRPEDGHVQTIIERERNEPKSG